MVTYIIYMVWYIHVTVYSSWNIVSRHVPDASKDLRPYPQTVIKIKFNYLISGGGRG